MTSPPPAALPAAARASSSSRRRRRLHPLFSLLVLLATVVGLAPRPARADCECGYVAAVHDDDGTGRALFTDLLETDFARLAGAGAGGSVSPLDDEAHGWARQAFNVTRERARGEYGEMFAVENVDFVTAAAASRQEEEEEEEEEEGRRT
ncbi:hypothetical protein VTH06DRAFT_2554, partial [Thermothelomyces fergusii]